MKFYFCERCGKRVTDSDLEAGQAADKKAKGVFCRDCGTGVMTQEFQPLTYEQARKITEQNRRLADEREANTLPSHEVRKVPPSPSVSSVPAHAAMRLQESARKDLKGSKGTAVLRGLMVGLVLAFILIYVTSGEWSSRNPQQENVRRSDIATSRPAREPSKRVASEPPLEEAPASNNPQGLAAYYYKDVDFKQLVLERVDPLIDFIWHEPPVQELPNEGYSVRWRGFIMLPESGEYFFVLNRNNRFRMKIGETWIFCSPTSFASTGKDMRTGSTPTLSKGKQAFLLEFIKSEGVQCQLRWKVPGSPARVTVPETAFVRE